MAVGRMAVGRKVAILGVAVAVAFTAGRWTADDATKEAGTAQVRPRAAPPSALRQLAQISQQLGAPADDPLAALLDAQARASGPERGRLLVLLGRTGRQEALPILIEAAGASSPAVRDGAIAGLGEHGDPEAVATLIMLCEHPSAWVRDAAVNGLRASGTDDARVHLEKLIFGHDEPLGRAAVEAMATWSDARTVELLVRVARGADPQLASYALDTLTKLQGPGALSALLALAEDPSLPRSLRASATAAAGARGPDAASQLTELALTADAQTADAALTALTQLGGDAAVEALSALAEQRQSMAYSAITGLARIGTPEATDALIGLASSSSSRTAQSAVAELVDIRGEAVDEFLLSVLRGGGYPAQRLIGRLEYVRRGPAFAKELAALVEEGDPMLSMGALHALSKQDPQVAASALSRVARRPGVKHLRLTAVDALASTPTDDAREALLALSRSSTVPREARVRAQRTLLESPTHRDRAVAGLLESARKSGDHQARVQAVSALAEVADPELAGELASLLTSAPLGERYGMVSAMAGTDGPSRKAITQAVLAIDNEDERLELLSNLVHYGDPEAIGALDELAAGDDAAARRALGSLAYVDPAAATAHAESLLEADDPADRQAALRAYQAAASPERLQVARRALDDDDSDVRAEAIRQLVADARPEALQALVGAGRQHPGEIASQAGSLLSTGDPGAQRLVRDLVLSDNDTHARHALDALLYHHEPVGRELLEELAASDTPRGLEIRERLKSQYQFQLH